MNDRSTLTQATPRPTSLKSKTISRRLTELDSLVFTTKTEAFPTITLVPFNVYLILTLILATRQLVEFNSNLRTQVLSSMVLPMDSNTRDSRRLEVLSLPVL